MLAEACWERLLILVDLLQVEPGKGTGFQSFEQLTAGKKDK